jgi:hypothetical protein
MKIPTDDPDWAPELYEARAMRPARRLSRSRAFSKSNGTTAPRGAWQSKPFTMADGNPGSRRWCIPGHGLSAGQRWRLSRDHCLGSKPAFRNRDRGIFAGTGIALGFGGLSDVACPSHYPKAGGRPIHDQEHINFPQHRDPLFGGGRVALHLLRRHCRHLGARAGGVEHNG